MLRTLLLCALMGVPAVAQDVELELVLLADASGSISEAEIGFQRQGYAAAMTDPRRKWLASALKRSGATLYIANGTLAYAKLGMIADEATRQQFEEVVEFLCDLAETIEG